MPYSQFTIAQIAAQISGDLDDEGQLFWSQSEIVLAIYESLLLWGAATNYWRSSGTFNITPNRATPYYDISSATSTSAQMAALRTRNWTLGTMVADIQNMLNEADNGISGAGMSAQTSITTILTAIQRARNRFVLDAQLPYTVNTITQPPTTQGTYPYAQSTVYVHRVTWKDSTSGVYENLWRQDAWAYDKSYPNWPSTPGTPVAFSELENAPLTLQLYPPPINTGSLEAITVDSLILNTASAASTFNIPDEWVHAVKYAALFELLSSDSQINDPLRADYCNSRYSQYVSLVENATSIFRVTVNSTPLPTDSFANIDANFPYWRNQSGIPTMAGLIYDMLLFSPGSALQTASVSCDVARTAPLPSLTQSIQLGDEDTTRVIDFATHLLLFKCGGNEFKSTYVNHDNFMSAVAARGQINAAKIMYMTAQFQSDQTEYQLRPNRKRGKAK